MESYIAVAGDSEFVKMSSTLFITDNENALIMGNNGLPPVVESTKTTNTTQNSTIVTNTPVASTFI